MIDVAEIASWQTWIGRSETSADELGAGPVERLSALLNHQPQTWDIGAPAPPLAHWLLFLPSAPQREIGVDGHPARGSFLPPVTLPRRMWAGSKIVFHHALEIGQAARRISKINNVVHKTGRSGELVFIDIHHAVVCEDLELISELQQIVYRQDQAAQTTPPNQDAPEASKKSVLPSWRKRVVSDPVLLFRFSALTFNGHRIHYDRDYARQIEGYPGLVVHGPLQAMLLLDTFIQHNPGVSISSFNFSSRRPLYDVTPFDLCGAEIAKGQFLLWIEDAEGGKYMEAIVEIR